MNNEILAKVDEIISFIKTSAEYQKYLFLQAKMRQNKELISLINEVKILQKDVVHHLDKKKDLEIKQQELNNYPLYREYLNTLSELNSTYAIIEQRINHYFTNILN